MLAVSLFGGGGWSVSLTAFRSFSGGSMPGLWRQRLPSAWALLLLPFLPLLLPAAPAPHRGSYKPVIVVHGLFDSSYSFRHLLDYINEVGRDTGCIYRGWGRKSRQMKDNPSRPASSSVCYLLLTYWGEVGAGVPGSRKQGEHSPTQWLHCPFPTDTPRDCGDSA